MSLSVVASAIVVALGLQVGDPIIGLIISLVILRITWQSFATVQRDPGSDESHESVTEPARVEDHEAMPAGHGHGHDH